MKKIAIVLGFLSSFSIYGACPVIGIIKVSCVLPNHKITADVYHVATKYHTAAPECIISDGRFVNDKGDFKITDIARNICHVTDFNKEIKVRFSTGVNWVFGAWVDDLPRTWVYTPAL